MLIILDLILELFPLEELICDINCPLMMNFNGPLLLNKIIGPLILPISENPKNLMLLKRIVIISKTLKEFALKGAKRLLILERISFMDLKIS